MAAALLDIADLTVSYSGARALEGVSLQVSCGEVVGVVGASGCGKSTLVRAALGLLDAGGRIDGGSVKLAGRELVGLASSELAAVRGSRMALVLQDPSATFSPVRTIGSQFLQTLRQHGSVGRRAQGEAEGLLAAMGLADPGRILASCAFELSGGMCQRAAIALALAQDPDVLFADEPTSALDVGTQAQVADELRTACKERGVGALVVSHNFDFISRVADRIIVMSDGEVVERGPSSSVMTHPRHPCTKALVAAIPRIDLGKGSGVADGGADGGGDAGADGGADGVAEGRAADSSSGSERVAVGAPGSVSPAARRAAQSEMSVLGSVRAAAGDVPPLAPPIALEARDVVKRFSGMSHPAVGGVTLALGEGECVGLVGESGSGKSTLARISVGLERPDEGEVLVAGRSVGAMRRRERRMARQSVQMVFQDHADSFDPRRRLGSSLVEFGADGGMARRDARRRASELFEAVGLPSELFERLPGEVSGGQRQRAAIARALMLRPRVLVCDEVTSALDVIAQQGVMEVLAGLKREVALLFISHDLALVSELCDRVAVMDAGRIVALGDARCALRAMGAPERSSLKGQSEPGEAAEVAADAAAVAADAAGKAG